jgi:hypothetical protein
MFNPALNFVFVENENENENEMVHPEFFIRDFLEFTSLLSLTIMIYSLLQFFQIPRIMYYLWQLMWSNLTPGQQWLELATIITGILSTFGMGFLLTKIAWELDDKITKMRESLKEKEKQIAELEAVISKLKKGKEI